MNINLKRDRVEESQSFVPSKRTKAAKSNLLILPNEIWLNILRRCHFNDVLNFELASKTTRNCAQIFWYHRNCVLISSTDWMRESVISNYDRRKIKWSNVNIINPDFKKEFINLQHLLNLIASSPVIKFRKNSPSYAINGDFNQQSCKENIRMSFCRSLSSFSGSSNSKSNVVAEEVSNLWIKLGYAQNNIDPLIFSLYKLVFSTVQQTDKDYEDAFTLLCSQSTQYNFISQLALRIDILRLWHLSSFSFEQHLNLASLCASNGNYNGLVELINYCEKDRELKCSSGLHQMPWHNPQLRE